MSFRPQIEIIGDTVPAIEITNLISYDPNLNTDEYEGLRYESPNSDYTLLIGGTEVPASFLTLRQGEGKYRPILKVTWRTTGSAALDWDDFEPGEYSVYLASNTRYWPEIYQGQLFLSKESPNDENLLNLPVIIKDGVVKRRVFGLFLGLVKINARILDGSGYRFDVILQAGYDPSLSTVSGGIVLEDPGTNPTRQIGDTEVQTSYLSLKIDQRAFRRPLQTDARRIYDPIFPYTPVSCNVYIAANSPEWDAIREGYRGNLFLVQSSTDPDHDSFPLDIGQGRVVDADYVGNINISFQEALNPFTVKSAYSAEITLIDNPRHKLHLISHQLVYVGSENELIAWTLVDARYLTLTSDAINFRYPLGQGLILYNGLKTKPFTSGPYHAYIGANTQFWDMLCPGFRNQLFLLSAYTDDFNITFPLYRDVSHQIGAKYLGRVDLEMTDGLITSCVIDSTDADLPDGASLSLDIDNHDLVYSSPGTYYELINGRLTYVGERRLTLDIITLRSPLYFEKDILYLVDEYESGEYYVYLSSTDEIWGLDPLDYRDQLFVIPAECFTSGGVFPIGNYDATYLGLWHVRLTKLKNYFDNSEGYSIQESWLEDNAVALTIDSQTKSLNYAQGLSTYALEIGQKPYRYEPIIPLSFNLEWMPETKFDLETPQTYQVYLAGIEDSWYKLNSYYPGQLFLINVTIDPRGDFDQIELGEEPAFCLHLGKITASFEGITDDFRFNAFGHKCTRLVIEPGSDPNLGITGDNVLYFSDPLIPIRTINSNDIDVSYLELALPIFNYKDILGLKTSGSTLDVQDFEPGDYYVYIASNEYDWVNVNPDYRANLYLSKDVPDGSNTLTISLPIGSIISLCVGQVTLSVGQEITHPSYLLSTNEAQDSLVYSDIIDSQISVGDYNVDVASLSLASPDGRYRLPLFPGDQEHPSSVLQTMIGEYNVYIADNDLKWDTVSKGFHSQLFLSKSDPDPETNLLNILLPYENDYVQALKVGRVNVTWRTNYTTGIPLTWVKYELTLLPDAHSHMSVTEDGDLLLQSPLGIVVSNTFVDASYLALRDGNGKFRNPVIKNIEDVFSTLSNLDSGDYGVYLAPNLSEWQDYAGQMFLSTIEPTTISGKTVLLLPGKKSSALKLADVTLSWSVISLPMSLIPIIEIDDQYTSSSRLSLEDGILVYKAVKPIPFIPTAEGSIRLDYELNLSIDMGDGVFRPPLSFTESTGNKPKYLSWNPGMYYVYIASIDQAWQEYKMNLFVSPDPPTISKRIYWTEKGDNLVSHYAYCLGRIKVRSSPYMYLYPYNFMPTEVLTTYTGLELSKFGDITFRDVQEVRIVDGEQVPTVSLTLDPSSDTGNFGLKLDSGGNLMKTQFTEDTWNLYLCNAKPIWGNLDLNAELFLSQIEPVEELLLAKIDGEDIIALYLGQVKLKNNSFAYTGDMIDWTSTALDPIPGDPPPLYYEASNLGTLSSLPVGGTLVVGFTAPDALVLGYPFSISLDCSSQAPFGSTTRVQFTSWILESSVDFSSMIASGSIDIPPVLSDFCSVYTYNLFSDTDPTTTTLTKVFSISDEIGCIGGLQISPGDTIIINIRFLDDNLFEEQSNSILQADFFIKGVNLIYKSYNKG
jgi:hypothetical protein